MKKTTEMAIIALLSLLGWQANAQNGSDDCPTATMVGPMIFIDTTITDVTPGTNNGDAAWFSYTATADGTITLDSGIDLDAPDTRVFIYDNCTDLTELAMDDDDGAGLTSLIEDFPVTTGTNYIIAWDDRWSIDPFDWELSFTPAPTGDGCAETLPIEPGIFLDAQINDQTTGTNNGDVLWYTYTAATNGAITIDSGIDPDDPDTRVFIYDNCTDLTELAMDDDSGATGATSRIENFLVEEGVTYIIGWDDRWSVEPFDWELTLISCEDPSDFDVTAGQTDAVFTWTDNPNATNGFILEVFLGGQDPEVDTPLATELIATGITTVTVTGLTEITDYDAYITSDCGTAGNSPANEIESFTTSGTPGSNATCDTALVIVPGMFIGQIVDANPGTGNDDSLWYSFTPGSDGDITITSCIGGDDDDTRVFLSEGPCDALVALEVDDDGCGAPDAFSSLIENFPVTAGTEYLIQWDDRWSTDEFDWELIFNTDSTPTTCEAAENIAISNILETTADLSWDEVPSAADGYQTLVYPSGATPLVDPTVYTSGLIPQGTTTDTATGLSPEIAYDAYVVSICDLDSDPPVFTFSEPITFNTILSIQDSALVTYTIHPNPASDTINLSAAFGIENIVVSNILGQRVLTNNGGSQELTLDIAGLQTGTYFIKATVNGIDVVEKFIKK